MHPNLIVFSPGCVSDDVTPHKLNRRANHTFVNSNFILVHGCNSSENSEFLALSSWRGLMAVLLEIAYFPFTSAQWVSTAPSSPFPRYHASYLG